MTNKTQVISIRLPNEVVEWLGKDNEAREIIESAYANGHLRLNEFCKACDAKRMDYQKVIDRMTDYINDPTKYNI